MIFEHGHIYHIYNQGNNRQQVFFIRENYLFFLKKVETFISPFTDILAWCLMPNHFHLMVYVKQVEIGDSRSKALSRATATKTLNKSIGVLLSSYTQAINIQENRSGSLFKPHTKAECTTKTEGITPSYFNTAHGTIINVQIPEKDYPQVCFNYIHNNPVKANLADHPEDWEFSSYRDYCGLRNGKHTNKTIAKEFGLII